MHISLSRLMNLWYYHRPNSCLLIKWHNNDGTVSPEVAQENFRDWRKQIFKYRLPVRFESALITPSPTPMNQESGGVVRCVNPDLINTRSASLGLNKTHFLWLLLPRGAPWLMINDTPLIINAALEGGWRSHLGGYLSPFYCGLYLCKVSFSLTRAVCV